MAAPTSDPLREFVDKRSEVLSDSTELDVLLAALLDDGSPPASIKPWPRPVVEARPEPALVAPPRVDSAPDRSLSPVIAQIVDADAETDAFEMFLSESEQQQIRASDKARATRGWRDIASLPTAKQSMLVAGLTGALVVLGVVYFRGASPVPQSAATVPTPVPAATAIESPTTAPAPAPSEVAELNPTPAREPTAKPRVITTPPARAASGRTNPVRAAEQPSALPPSSTSSVGASTAVAQPMADAADPGTTPAPVAPTVVEAPGPPTSPAAPTAAAANSAEPVVTASARPVPAGAAQATPARLLEGGVPPYPAALRTARVGGNVDVRFTIDSSGRVTNVRSLTGPAQLRSVAEAAVRRWRYEPAHLGNVAINTETSVTFNFDPWAPRRPEE